MDVSVLVRAKIRCHVYVKPRMGVIARDVNVMMNKRHNVTVAIGSNVHVVTVKI
tara:strand:- start:134 stop:295 length:162 start_codon:yes stop_codon:yes gene_type:complete